MRHFAAVLLACLLVTGTVTAASMNIGQVQAAKTVAPVSSPVTRVTTLAAARVPVTLITQATGKIEVYSDPSGADVSLNGVHNPPDTTPVIFANRPAGTYTVVVSHAGYEDYTETFYLAPGAIKGINAVLKGRFSGINIQGVPPAPHPTAYVPLGYTGTAAPRLTVMPGRTIMPRPVYTCDEMVYPGYTCMLLAEAQQSFGPGWTYFVDKPCGYATVNNVTYTKYCCHGEPKGTIQRTAVRANVTLPPVPGLRVVSNRTRFYDPGQTLVPVLRGAVVQRQKDLISSFLGLFSGLFGQKTCPAGQLSCGTTCVDPGSDPQNCGKCGMTCTTNFTCCSGECTELPWDSANCGTCGMTCFAPAFCCAGSCEETCDPYDGSGFGATSFFDVTITLA